VGAALPLWSVPPPASLRTGSALHEPEVGWPAGEAVPPIWRGPLWRAAELRLAERRWLRSVGFPAPLVRIDDDFVLAPLILLPTGAGVGLLAYLGCFWVRRWKGGGAGGANAAALLVWVSSCLALVAWISRGP
jgi:hypothetical protein